MLQPDDTAQDGGVSSGKSDNILKNPYISFHVNDDGTIESGVIQVSYSDKVGQQVATDYFDRITNDYAAQGVILHFDIVGPSDHLLSGVLIWLNSCSASADACGSFSRGEAEVGGRVMYYSASQAVTTPDHEFGHILGFADSNSGIMSGAGNRQITFDFVQRLRNCYIGNSC